MTTGRSAPRRRTTWQRTAVLQAMQTARCHVPAEDIHRRLRRGGRSIGLATVYRALEAFVREGLVEPVYVGDGRIRYGLAANHHDHLICLGCGEWKPLDECVVPRPSGPIASGFRVTGHQLKLHGYCAQCQVVNG